MIKNQPLHNWAGDVEFMIHQLRSMKELLESDHFNPVRMYNNLEYYAKKLEPTAKKLRKRALKEEGEEIL